MISNIFHILDHLEDVGKFWLNEKREPVRNLCQNLKFMREKFEKFTDFQWEVLAEFLPLQRKRKNNVRVIIESIRWLNETSSQCIIDSQSIKAAPFIKSDKGIMAVKESMAESDKSL